MFVQTNLKCGGVKFKKGAKFTGSDTKVKDALIAKGLIGDIDPTIVKPKKKNTVTKAEKTAKKKAKKKA